MSKAEKKEESFLFKLRLTLLGMEVRTQQDISHRVIEEEDVELYNHASCYFKLARSPDLQAARRAREKFIQALQVDSERMWIFKQINQDRRAYLSPALLGALGAALDQDTQESWKVLEMLQRNGANLRGTVHFEGCIENLIHFAARTNCVLLFQFLMEKKIFEPRECSKPNSKGETPLFLASAQGHSSMIDLLLPSRRPTTMTKVHFYKPVDLFDKVGLKDFLPEDEKSDYQSPSPS